MNDLNLSPMPAELESIHLASLRPLLAPIVGDRLYPLRTPPNTPPVYPVALHAFWVGDGFAVLNFQLWALTDEDARTAREQAAAALMRYAGFTEMTAGTKATLTTDRPVQISGMVDDEMMTIRAVMLELRLQMP